MTQFQNNLPGYGDEATWGTIWSDNDPREEKVKYKIANEEEWPEEHIGHWRQELPFIPNYE